MGKDNKEMLKRILNNTELIMTHLKIKQAPAKSDKKNENAAPKKLPAAGAKKVAPKK